ncbi:MAG: hypothetical protein K6U74_04555 [Firmicutes bacterium]|nr:hypothetical protein [Bacillota bacterium]
MVGEFNFGLLKNEVVKIKNYLNNEQGNILVLTAAVVFTLCLLWAGTVEYGRWLITKEQTQTAVDADSLASSLSGVHRWVKIDVVTDRGDH